MADWVDNFYADLESLRKERVNPYYQPARKTVADLYAVACEGDLCLVTDENRFYTYEDGTWLPMMGVKE